MTSGSWTGCQCVRMKLSAKLTRPEDKVCNHPVALQPGAIGESVGIRLQRRPDRFKHDEHTRCTDVGVDTFHQLYSCRCCTSHIPEVDQTKDHTGDDGKVGKVETKRSTRGNGEGDVVTGTDHTVKGDGRSDDNISDRTGINTAR